MQNDNVMNHAGRDFVVLKRDRTVAQPLEEVRSQVAPGLGVVYYPANLDGYDDAYVRVGYSAPGTGGMVWTSGKWLR